MQFILTLDTEGDNQWNHGGQLTVENIKYIPRFQNLCTKYKIKPTYLITSEVCEDAFAKELFSSYLKQAAVEVGAHLHSWTSPPFQDKEGFRFNDKAHPFASELSEIIIDDKIRSLTYQIEAAFGKRPTSFRSGRYGFNEKVGAVLARYGYVIDSSVTPYTSWKNNKGLPSGEGGPDFMDKTAFPYIYNFNDYKLIEIPVTVLPTRFPLNTHHALAVRFFRSVNKSIFIKIFRKIIYQHQPLWLRPYPWMNRLLLTEILNEAARIDLPYLVMMFHSSELMPGCSFYRKNNKEIEALYELLEEFFILLQARRIPSITLTGAAHDFKI